MQDVDQQINHVKNHKIYQSNFQECQDFVQYWQRNQNMYEKTFCPLSAAVAYNYIDLCNFIIDKIDPRLINQNCILRLPHQNELLNLNLFACMAYSKTCNNEVFDQLIKNHLQSLNYFNDQQVLDFIIQFKNMPLLMNVLHIAKVKQIRLGQSDISQFDDDQCRRIHDQVYEQMKDFSDVKFLNIENTQFGQELYVTDQRIEDQYKHKNISIQSSEEFKINQRLQSKTLKCINQEKLGSCYYKNCQCWHDQIERRKVELEMCKEYKTKEECDKHNPYMCLFDHQPEHKINKNSYHVQKNFLKYKLREVKGNRYTQSKLQFKKKLDSQGMPRVLKNLLEEFDYIDLKELNNKVINTQFVKNVINLHAQIESSHIVTPELKEHYHQLLWLEELQSLIDIRQQDVSRYLVLAKDEKGKLAKCYRIQVEGLAEKRPSVMLGDEIIATLDHVNNAQHETKLIGYVWKVGLEDVLVNFGSAPVQENLQYNLMFQMNRTQFKLKHRSIDLAEKFYNKLTQSHSQTKITMKYQLSDEGVKNKDTLIQEFEDIEISVNVVCNLQNEIIEDLNLLNFMIHFLVNDKYDTLDGNQVFIDPEFTQSIDEKLLDEIDDFEDSLNILQIYKSNNLMIFLHFDLNQNLLRVICPHEKITNCDNAIFLYKNRYGDEIKIQKEYYTTEKDSKGICSVLYNMELVLNNIMINVEENNDIIVCNLSDQPDFIKSEINNRVDQNLIDKQIIVKEFETEDSRENNIETTTLDCNTLGSLNLQQAKFIEMNTQYNDPRVKILFGPPGTGKTHTLIELVKTLLLNKPESRMLLCASSNNAADLICQRLDKFVEEQELSMFRMNAISRSLDDLTNSEVQKWCQIANGQQVVPKLDILKTFNVMVATCASAGLLQSMGWADLVTYPFDQVAVDEAGECNFVEAFIPLQVASTCTKIMFCGDWKQLGPVVRSKVCLQCKFDESVIEKCVKHFQDQCHTHMLVKSYRAHSSILHLQNKLFQENKLVAERDQTDASVLYNKRRDIFKGNSPVRFIHLEGFEDRQSDSPSWQNEAEIEEVIKLLTSLIIDKGQAIKPCDIGVIAPYRKQVQMINNRFKINEFRHLYGVKVGTVDSFQGMEKRVIIVTSVRSQKQRELNNDRRFRIGFVSNQKRMNVAISRAMDGLIIVGNAKMLGGQDLYWHKLLEMLGSEKQQDGCLENIKQENIPNVSKQANLDEEDEENVLNADTDFDVDKY